MCALKVGFVFDDSLERPGGVGQYCLTLGAELQRRGHEVVVLVGGPKSGTVNGIEFRGLSRNLDVRMNGNAMSTPVLPYADRLQEVRAMGLDVLHVQMPYSPLLAGRIIAQADPATAVVGTFHIATEGPVSRIGRYVLAVWMRPTLRRFDRVIAVSPIAADYATGAFGIKDVVRVPNFVPSVPVPPARDLGGVPSIVFVGRLEPRKGAQHLVEELPAILERVPDARLFIVGDGSLRGSLEARVASLGIGPSVEFLGALDDDGRDALLAAADVACFPATGHESFGIVLIEGIRAGAGAVVGGDNAGYRDVLDNDERVLADPTVKGALAGKVADLLTDPDLRAAVHESQQQLLGQYRVEVVAERVLEIYQEALQRRSALKDKRRP